MVNKNGGVIDTNVRIASCKQKKKKNGTMHHALSQGSGRSDIINLERHERKRKRHKPWTLPQFIMHYVFAKWKDKTWKLIADQFHVCTSGEW